MRCIYSSLRLNHNNCPSFRVMALCRIDDDSFTWHLRGEVYQGSNPSLITNYYHQLYMWINMQLSRLWNYAIVLKILLCSQVAFSFACLLKGILLFYPVVNTVFQIPKLLLQLLLLSNTRDLLSYTFKYNFKKFTLMIYEQTVIVIAKLVE